MKEKLSPKQVQELRDFHLNDKIARRTEKNLWNPQLAEVNNEAKRIAFEHYYSLTRNIDSEGKIIHDYEMIKEIQEGTI